MVEFYKAVVDIGTSHIRPVAARTAAVAAIAAFSRCNASTDDDDETIKATESCVQLLYTDMMANVKVCPLFPGIPRAQLVTR